MPDNTERIEREFPLWQFLRGNIAPSLQEGAKNLSQTNLDIAPLDPVQMITRELNFPNAAIDHRTDTPVLPEQLDTTHRIGNHVMIDHLQKVANSFENYANRLMGALAPKSHGNKDSAAGAAAAKSDSLTHHNCPFMRVANAVGMKYPAKGGAGESGTTGAN